METDARRPGAIPASGGSVEWSTDFWFAFHLGKQAERMEYPHRRLDFRLFSDDSG
jgi:hypothetical protein